METAALKELLAKKMGLDTDSLGPWFLGSVARWGLQQSGCHDVEEFVAKAAAGGELWQRLVEHVVVAETWFFRDTAPFEHLVDVVRAKWAGPNTAPVRILSCPCSTGEEPYSVALALTAAGFQADAFAIDAADVSPKAIHAARTGAYRARSFRRSDSLDRDRCFDYDAGSRLWRIQPAFLGMVRFEVVNVVSPDAFASAGRYDMVLCRNLLIYLHSEARASLLAGMKRLLKDDGVLIVGHAEAGLARENGFAGSGDPKAFAFVQGGNARPKKTITMSARVHHAPGKPPAAGPPPAIARVTREHPRAMEPTLDHARQLGDQGRTEEAIRACREYLKLVPDSAEGHFLLGVLCGALGQERASETALRRALYLEPDHVAALQHLAVTHDAKGDSDGAARLRSRARRSEARRGGP